MSVWGGTCTCRCTAAEGRGRGDGWGDRRGEVSTGVARWSGNTASRQAACQRQWQLGLHLLLHGLMFSPRSVCHESRLMGHKARQVLPSFLWKDTNGIMRNMLLWSHSDVPRALVWKFATVETWKKNIIGFIPFKKTPGFMMDSKLLANVYHKNEMLT